MNANSTTLQTATTLSGILFLLVATAANFSTYHSGKLYMDAASQVFAFAKTEKFRKYLPVLTCIFTVTFLEVIELFDLVSEQQPIPRTFIRNHKFRPRSPPVNRI